MKRRGREPLKKGDEDAVLIAVDECGFCEKPLVKRTWARRGQTPVLRENNSWNKLTAIGALSLQPSGRLNEQFQLLRGSARTIDFLWFLLHLRKRYRKKLLIVWDNLSAHKAAARFLQSMNATWVEFIWLPAYSPDLNPVEWLWNNTKYHELANYAPANLDALESRVNESLDRPKHNQRLLRSFFQGAKLSTATINN